MRCGGEWLHLSKLGVREHLFLFPYAIALGMKSSKDSPYDHGPLPQGNMMNHRILHCFKSDAPEVCTTEVVHARPHRSNNTSPLKTMAWHYLHPHRRAAPTDSGVQSNDCKQSQLAQQNQPAGTPTSALLKRCLYKTWLRHRGCRSHICFRFWHYALCCLPTARRACSVQVTLSFFLERFSICSSGQCTRSSSPACKALVLTSMGNVTSQLSANGSAVLGKALMFEGGDTANKNLLEGAVAVASLSDTADEPDRAGIMPRSPLVLCNLLAIDLRHRGCLR